MPSAMTEAVSATASLRSFELCQRATNAWTRRVSRRRRPRCRPPAVPTRRLSVFVVAFTMTAPMVAWMVYRGMPQRPIAEMAAVMPILAAALLVLGWLSVLPTGDLALWEHGLMMPAMLVPMFLRLDLYTSRHSHHQRPGRRVGHPLRNAHGH